MLPAATRWPTWIRPQDLFWIALFLALEYLSPDRNLYSGLALVVLGIFQLAEARIPALQSVRGRVAAVGLKLILCYAIVGYTGGITSSYWVVLMLPVISAGASLGTRGALATLVLSCLAYLSFAHPLALRGYELMPEGWQEIAVRLTFFCVVGYLAHQNRVEAQRYQHAAEQLAAANRNLQAAEATARRNERLAALGQMSAGLAHELRNPLATMRTSAEMLLKNLPPGNALLQEMAGFVATEVDRLNSLITRFLDFARPLELRPALTEISSVIDRAIRQVESRRPPLEVQIYRNDSPDIRPFELDSELLESVFVNLIVNAAQASPPGGAVTVKTRESGGLVEIAVIDRGRGIAPEHRESIFNPFFTTKPDGVGLGLSIVSKIVDAHAGRILVDSQAGEGSVFRVVLPARRPARQKIATT